MLLNVLKECGVRNFCPKIPSYRVKDVAKAISSNAKIKIIGIRPGKKFHEEMITKADSSLTANFDDYYVIMPVEFSKSYGITILENSGSVKENYGYGFS